MSTIEIKHSYYNEAAIGQITINGVMLEKEASYVLDLTVMQINAVRPKRTIWGGVRQYMKTDTCITGQLTLDEACSLYAQLRDALTELQKAGVVLNCNPPLPSEH